MTRTGTEPKELTPRQERAIVALLAYRNVKEAAAETGTPARTLYRWLRDDRFRTALLTAEGEAIDEATRRLIALQAKALDVFDNLLDPIMPPSIRLRAAQNVLDFLLRLRELRNLEERIARLEAQYGVQGAGAN